ncbi:zinc-dependent alcohol dehydrogenase family protein [Herbaspirillum sp. RV1423]|uniref:zinc-dependent alcohol dehydrogenase family protein n=1 Tax=Herbaspirillum sp. RV1423 TaxID=1443993 RepID=UPI00054D6499|nr:zinc-dependent alcohol dehydrogenase family protein [Herbaspirillum sp. RV1423]
MSSRSAMTAVLLSAYGAPLQIARIDRPDAGPGQVLVRIEAAGLNPLDAKIRAGKAAHAKAQLPAVLGIDMAGTVAAVGPGVSAFEVGDEVYGMTGGVGGVQGSLAQFAAVDADLLAHKPAAIGMRTAAALPLIFITAWEGLVDRAKVRAGQKVLVHGGAGGVGHIAVQIAKAFDADVYATGSAEQHDAIAGYGATFIDYRAATVDEYVQQYTGGEGFDIVYDTVGGATLDASFTAARRYHGHVVSCLGWGTHALAPLSFRAATYSGVFTLMPLLTGKGRAQHGKIMREAARLVDAGDIRVQVDPRNFALERADAAYDLIDAGGARGKLVIDIPA